MHRCPSKGRLLELKDTIGIEPYKDYCLHCDHYRESVEKAGLQYIYDFCGIDKASCSILVYDPEKFPKKLIVDKDTLQMHRNAADNEYFHKDFHSSLNNGINYLGKNYGVEVLKDYLQKFTNNVYKNVIANISKRGIEAIKEKIVDTYIKEKSEEVLHIKEEADKTIFEIDYCPAVKHLNDTGRKVTPWFEYSTTVIMEVFAKYAGLKFTMEAYDPATGKAKYRFSK
jgi:hypothetical protein